jgi:hypothetical protein
MKALKIILAVIVVAAIAFFVRQSLVTIDATGKISLPENQFTKRLEQEIDSLGKLPNSKFCNDFYREISYHIDSYYDENRLGATPSENEQWKENLSKNLYSVYVGKFIRQAFYVFRHSEWKIENLNFIRDEYQTLRKSKLLEKGSPADEKFKEIQTVFSKYDEIVGFITACKGFSYSADDLSDRFPIAGVKAKISQAAKYLNNHLENKHVNHCTRLHNGLKEIPQILFRTHTRYLDNKINRWSDLYHNYNSQSDYANNLYKPLKNEIEALDNNIYNVANFDKEYNKLLDKWSADNTKAYNYSYPPALNDQ